MKIQVTMKTPDALTDAILDAVGEGKEAERVERLASKWFQYGEYLTVTIDTEKKTCTINTV